MPLKYQTVATADQKPSLTSYALIPSWSHIVSLALVTLFIIGIGIYYYLTIKRLKPHQSPRGLTYLIFMYVEWVRNISNDILGPRFDRFVPYFIYIFSLLTLSNLIAIAGFEPISTSLTIPLSLGVVAFLGTIISGIKYRKWSYINDYATWWTYQDIRIFPIPDPLKVIGEISRIISLVFRLWGNTIAGTVIVALVYYVVTLGIFEYQIGVTFLGAAVASFISFPFHFYFDILDGVIQPMIFMMLSMSYWAIGASLSEKAKYSVNTKRHTNNYFSSAMIVRELIYEIKT